MTNIDRRQALILLSAVVMAAIMSGIVISAYSADNGQESNNSIAGLTNGRTMPWTHGWSNGPHCGPRYHGFVEVSTEFEENVTNIAKSDQDVQNLLNDGYNITGVKPIIKARVEASGDVATKATSAIVIMEKDTTSHVSVWVDVEQGKVTRIEILTRTVIDKS